MEISIALTFFVNTYENSFRSDIPRKLDSWEGRGGRADLNEKFIITYFKKGCHGPKAVGVSKIQE